MVHGGPARAWSVSTARPVNAGGFLPPYIPMDGTLYLGKEDGWPYKLVLVGRKPSTVFETRRLGPDGRPIGVQELDREDRPQRDQADLLRREVERQAQAGGVRVHGAAVGKRRRQHRSPRQGARSGDPARDPAQEK